MPATRTADTDLKRAAAPRPPTERLRDNGQVPDLLLQILIGLSLLLSAVALVPLVLNRPAGGAVIGMVFVLTIALLIGLFAGIVAVAQPGNDVNRWTYIGYLGAALLAVPGAALWAAEERSRAGTAIYVAVGLVVAFLLLRTGQIWAAGV